MRSAICSRTPPRASARSSSFSCVDCGRLATSSSPNSPRISPASRKRAKRRVTRPSARPPATCASPTSRSGCRRRRGADAHRESLAAAQAELSRLTAFWHYFRRRRQQRALETLRQGVVVADAAVGELHAEKSAIMAEAAPEFAGISLSARRNINLAIISYAESLCDMWMSSRWRRAPRKPWRVGCTR